MPVLSQGMVKAQDMARGNYSCNRAERSLTTEHHYAVAIRKLQK